MAAKKKSKSNSTNSNVAIGVGLTAAAVAAAGAYFLYGSSEASQNRKKVKGWMLKAKGEVLETLEKAEQMTEREFNQLVETVGKSYSKLKDASQADIASFKREMKQHWPEIVKEGAVITGAVVSAANKAKKSTKKAASKTAKKATKTAKKATKKATKK